MSKPNGAVFHAVRRSYISLIENHKHNQDREHRLKAQLTALEAEMAQDAINRRELDNFAMQMGWSVKDLTE